MTYKIEKGIPVPQPATGRHRKGKTKYPWAEMQVGDSVFFAGDGGKQQRHKLCSSTIHWSRSNSPSAKFITRSVDGGVRVWRVK